MRCHGLALILVSCTGLVHPQGIITTIAGGGVFQVTGIGGTATSVPLGAIQGVATDSQGNVFVSDGADLIVVKISTTGVLTIVAGNGTYGFGGDGGPATNASFGFPGALAADASGDIFIVDGNRIREVTPQGMISTVAGTGLCGVASFGCLSATVAPRLRQLSNHHKAWRSTLAEIYTSPNSPAESAR
jgi:hypothetical protein